MNDTVLLVILRLFFQGSQIQAISIYTPETNMEPETIWLERRNIDTNNPHFCLASSRYTPENQRMTGWKIHISNRKYIFIYRGISSLSFVG